MLFRYICVTRLLFWIKTSVSRNVMLVCDIVYSNLFQLCFLFKLFQQFVSFSLVRLHMKNISSMNHKQMNDGPGRKGYIYFFSKWSMKILVWNGSHIVPMTQSFIWRKSQNVFTILVATILLVSNDTFTAFIPPAFGILVYKDLTLKDIKYALSRTDFSV